MFSIISNNLPDLSFPDTINLDLALSIHIER